MTDRSRRPATFQHKARWLTLLICLTAGAARADDWPNWRGPDHNGVSKETNWRTDWATNPPKAMWRARVGLGFSSLAVADGRVYTLGYTDGNEIVYCLDANTGQVNWRHQYACDKIARFYEGGSSSTPTVDAGRVYVLGKEGQLFCVDAASGKRYWYNDLREKLGSKVPEWGYACSPLIVGDHVVVQAGVVAAFDKTTGKLAWQSRRFNQGYGSPRPFKKDGKTWLAVLNTDGLIVVDAANGNVPATTRWKTMFSTNATTPIVGGDRIFVSTGYGKGCGVFQFTGSELKQIYAAKTMSNHFNNCVLIDGRVYGFHGQAHFGKAAELKCIDFDTGNERWAQGGLGCGALMAAGDRLIVLSEKGDLVIAKVTTKSYEEIARLNRAVKGKCWTTPVLANGRIYCRSGPGDLACFDVSK